MNLKIIAMAVLAVIILGYLMIRRAPNAKWMILSLMFIMIVSGLAIVYIQNGPSLFATSLGEQRVAYVSDDGKQTDLWTMRLDGSDKKRVTDDSANERGPVWSPDGSQIAYLSDRVDGKFQLMLSLWNGRSERLMTSSQGTKDCPIFVHNGKDILYISNGKVFMVDRLGSEEKKILPPAEADKAPVPGQGATIFNRIAYSPNNEYLLCVRELESGLGQFVYALETPNGEFPTDMEKMKPLGQVNAKQVDAFWSPKGNTFAAALIDSEGANVLNIMDMDDMKSTAIMLTKGDTKGPGKVTWSPDGNKLIFEVWNIKDGLADKCEGLYVADLKTAKPAQLIAGDTQQPAFSADGKYVFYTKPRSDGKRDIWRISADGSNPQNMTLGKGDNSFPTCSPLPAAKS